jgi:hypothetical protein
MINISTNINPITIISYLKSLNIQKHTTYAVGNSDPGLRQDDGLLDPCDMVELLNKCRLKVLSQDLYPIQERIGKLVFFDGERISVIY